jgi:hypothetical protein
MTLRTRGEPFFLFSRKERSKEKPLGDRYRKSWNLGKMPFVER